MNLHISVGKRPERANCRRCEKVERKRSGFVICSYYKENVFTVVKRNAKFQPRYVKGVPFGNRIKDKEKGYLFGR